MSLVGRQIKIKKRGLKVLTKRKQFIEYHSSASYTAGDTEKIVYLQRKESIRYRFLYINKTIIILREQRKGDVLYQTFNSVHGAEGFLILTLELFT